MISVEQANQGIDAFNKKDYRQAIELLTGCDQQNAMMAFATAHEYVGNIETCLQLFQQAYESHPGVTTAIQYVGSLYRNGDSEGTDAAISRLPQDIADNQIVQYLRSEQHLKAWRFAEGFDLFGARRFSIGAARRLQSMRCPEWDGQLFDGMLHIIVEQGVGDIVQQLAAAHYIPQQQKVLLFCEERIAPLIKRSFPQWDITSHPMALQASATSTTARKALLGDIQARYIKSASDWNRHKWLVPNKDLMASYKKDRPRIGLSWWSPRGNDSSRKQLNITPFLNAGLNAEFVSLQHGAADDRLSDPLCDKTDIDRLAALIATCDAVVTCSNTAAHIAGALGVHTELVLESPRAVYWYWQYNNQSPIYRAVRISRLYAGDTRESVISRLQNIVYQTA